MSTCCIICYNSTSTTSEINGMSRFERELKVNQNKYLLSTFYHHFQLDHLTKSKTIGWNLRQENIPFCATCLETVINLVELHRQLDSLQKAIGRVDKNIKNLIVQSSPQLTQNVDKRVKIVRDLIVGPDLCISKLAFKNSPLIPQPSKGPQLRIIDESENSENEVDDLQSQSSDTTDPMLISYYDVEVILKDNGEEISSQQQNDPVESTEEIKKLRIKINQPKSIKIESNSNEDRDDPNDMDYEPTKLDLKYGTEYIDSKKVNKVKMKDEIRKDNLGQGREKRKVIQLPGEKYKFSYCGYQFSGMESEGFKCSLCENKLYNRKYDAILHIRWEHMNESKSNLCDLCGKNFHKKSDLRRHVKTHDKPNPVVCHLCGGSYKDGILLARHVASMHEHANTILCQYCSCLMPSPHKLLRHIQQFHTDPSSEELPLNILKCPHCVCTFIRHMSLTRHIRRYHKETLTTDPNDPGNSLPSTSATSTMVNQPASSQTTQFRPCMCPRCDACFTQTSDLADHMTLTHKVTDAGMKAGKFFQCKFCNVTYGRMSSLRKHEHSVHGVKYKWNAKKSKPVLTVYDGVQSANFESSDRGDVGKNPHLEFSLVEESH